MIHVTEKKLLLPADGSCVVDFGLDAFANLTVTTSFTRPAEVELLIGEVLTPEGRIDRAPGGFRTIQSRKVLCPAGEYTFRFEIDKHRTPYAGNREICAPEEAEGEIVPFRYAELVGGEASRPVRLARREVYGPVPDDAARFVSSDAQLNRIWEFCRYTMKATSCLGFFVDGERERLPYEGDAYINQLGYFCCGGDREIPRNTIDWLLENPTWPIEWRLIMPRVLRDYLFYTGDRESVANWLPVMRDQLRALREEHGADGLLRAAPRPYVGSADLVDWPEGERNGYVFGEFNLVPGCYYFGALETMAELTGDSAYSAMAAEAKASLVRLMFDAGSGLFVDSPGAGHTAQHSAVFPLFFGVADDPEPLKRFLLSRRIDCSVYVAQFLLESCFRFGMEEHAVELITGGGLRSWTNMLEKGATITMEAWDDSLKENQDWNHAWGAAPANIIPRFIGGIRPLEPGFARFTVDPRPGKVKSFELRHPTPHGAVELSYDGGALEFTVPEGATALCRGREFGAGKHAL